MQPGLQSGSCQSRGVGCHTPTFAQIVGNFMACRYKLALRSSIVGNRSSFVGNRSSFLDNQSSLVGNRPSFLDNQSSLVGNRPLFVRNSATFNSLSVDVCCYTPIQNSFGTPLSIIAYSVKKHLTLT